ncbi:hypothetical protein N7499_009740 [Penicillium canescens]|nr:hypothetical protein N7499_009740 [Penicillium canescens]
MSDEPKGKSFPDVSAKLSALPKKSLFERQKAEAEAKRAREKAETAAVYEDFVKSFEDDAPTGPKSSDGRLNTFGSRGGGLGGPSKRHFTASASRNSGPGTLGPPPPSLSRKRTHEGFAPSHRDQPKPENAHSGPSGPASAFGTSEADRAAEEAERAASKPTLHLASLPPGTSPSVIKALIPSILTVDNVKILRPPGQSPTERRSSAAIVTLTSDAAASDIDTTVSTLQNKYLGWGYYLTLSRHLSSAAIGSNVTMPVGISSTASLPFGAKNIQPTLVGSLSRAPPPGSHRGGSHLLVEVKAPSDIKQLRLIHKTLENLLNLGPEFEALLMSRPEVQREEKWAWLWDARSVGGVYYRWKLWQVVTNPRARKAQTHKPTTVFEGGPDWAPPKGDLKFEYTTRLDEFVSDEDYNSSDEEHSDGEDERRNLSGAPPDVTNAHSDGVGYMNPMRKAKLTHLLARLPTGHARLRRAYTGANPDRESEKSTARSESADKENPTTAKETLDVSASKLVGLYIISDILSSSATSGVRHAWRYRQLFESALRTHKVFEHLGRLDKDLNWGRLKAEKWKRSVGTLLHLWEGWCVFAQSSQEHFVQVFEKPPLTENELQKDKEKAEAERAAAAFAKSKSRWKTVDDDESAGKFDPTRPAPEESQPTVGPAEDESMSDIDGVPMEDSDLEELDSDLMNKELPRDTDDIQDQPPQQPQQTSQPSEQPKQPTGQREPEGRQRKPRPKAEDMFASDSE